jgi:hypothetical protein
MTNSRQLRAMEDRLVAAHLSKTATAVDAYDALKAGASSKLVKDFFALAKSLGYDLYPYTLESVTKGHKAQFIGSAEGAPDTLKPLSSAPASLTAAGGEMILCSSLREWDHKCAWYSGEEGLKAFVYLEQEAAPGRSYPYFRFCLTAPGNLSKAYLAETSNVGSSPEGGVLADGIAWQFLPDGKKGDSGVFTLGAPGVKTMNLKVKNRPEDVQAFLAGLMDPSMKGTDILRLMIKLRLSGLLKWDLNPVKNPMKVPAALQAWNAAKGLHPADYWK